MSFYSYDSAKRRFYMKDFSYTAFENFNEENFQNVNKGIEAVNQIFSSRQISKSRYISAESDKYAEFLRYFATKSEYTYDEKVYMLIKLFDPNLYMYKLFSKTRFITNAEIKQASSIEQKDSLIYRKQIILDEFKEMVRKQLGFYESKLVRYEKDFYNKFLNNDYFNINNMAFFYEDNNIDFNSLSEGDINRIILIADTYREKFGNNPEKLKKLLINDMYSLGLKNNTETAYMFIMAIDPELRLLDVYIMESKWDVVKEICLEEYGIFSRELIRVENKYNNSLDENKKKTF